MRLSTLIMIDEIMEEKHIQYEMQIHAADTMLEKYREKSSDPLKKEYHVWDDESHRLHTIGVELHRKLKVLDEARKDLRTHSFF